MRYLSYQIIFFLFSISIFAQSPHGDKFDLDCSNCHTADSWKIDRTKITFDHSKTNFALIGQHINVDCKSCHQSLVFSKMEKDCFSCHKDIHQATVGLDCASCHTPTTWIVKDIVGLHQMGRFPLLGVHQTADCAQCHSGYTELNFEPLNIDCYTCHKQNYESTQNPNHVAANFSTECQDCHNISALSWNATNIDHGFFPLVGGHALPSCYSCHQQGGNFSGLSPDCYSCHQQTYEATQNPNHIAAGLPTTCNVCHNINGWIPASFNHDITQFPLTGKHINVDCSKCHATGYTGTPTDCYSCHRQDYESVTDPNHVASQFPTDCTLCHTTAGWEGATFDHNQSSFPLTGSHVQTACANCHTNGYTGTPTDCYSCHQEDFQSTADPNHVAQNYPHDCTLCHNTIKWDDATFDHNNTQFPLTGSHIQAPCASCHQNGYSGTSSVCSDCHITSYNNSVNPNHSAAGLSTDCSTCHNSNAWSPSTFDHSSTGFTLLGSHQPLQCSSCHIGTTSGLTTDCLSCHQTDYNQAPNHTAQSFPTNCEICHNSVAWNQVTFDHQNTSFPLTGAHITTNCQLCHQTGYTGTPTDCYACHTTDFNSTINPNHQTSGIPTTCVDCHSTVAWQPATFDHSTTQFPLTGAHITTTCQSCHLSGYTNTPTDCYTCHITDYNNTTNPNHIAANFPTTCKDCHSTTAWQPATFDHDNQYFPIYSGSHNGKWNQCSECHTTPNNYSLFSCIDCHEHRQSEMDIKHQGVNNYVYNSLNCFDCHPDGRHRPVFNHTITEFPLTGAHIQVECAQCHNSNQERLPSECMACHMQDYLKSVNPNHPANGISTDCISCHSTNNWNSGSKILQENKVF